MDIEQPVRKEVIEAICAGFDVREEVALDTSQGKLRCDLVAISRTSPLEGIAIGFEVKSPKSALNFQNWAKVFKQAADYVDGSVIDKRLPKMKLRAVFVFPSPPYVPEFTSLTRTHQAPWYREEQLLQYAGVIHLAQHLRVGYADWRMWGNKRVFHLSMGPNPIWNSERGWARDATNLFSSKRLGSQVMSQK